MHALLPAGSAQSAGRAAPARVSVWRPNPKARRPKLSRGKRGSARSQLDPSGPGLNPSEKSPSAKNRRQGPLPRSRAACPGRMSRRRTRGPAQPRGAASLASNGAQSGVADAPAGAGARGWRRALPCRRRAGRAPRGERARPPRRSPRRRRKNGPRGPAVPDRASRAPLVEAGERVLGAGERQGDLGPEDRLGKAGALGRHGEEGENRALAEFATITPCIAQTRKRLNGLALPH